MARPQKDNAEYFAHDKGMRDNRKVKAVRQKFGLEGYAVWCMLIEALTDCDGFRMEWNELSLELLAGDFGLEPNALEQILDCFRRLKLIVLTSTELYSPGLLERMEPLQRDRERKRDWAREKAKTQDPATEHDKGFSTSLTPQSKVKESKVYLSIGEQSEKYILVLAKYSSDKPKKIYSLRAHFEITGQIEAFNSVGFVHFEAFMTANTGKMFNDDSHLDNTFRNFCKDYKPPPSEPIKYENAEYNKSLWTTEAWEEFYSKRLLSDADFRKHFGYGELFVSKAVG
jgi:hypothetical protein